MPHLTREIQEQPDVVARVIREESGEIEKIAQAIREFDPVFVMIAARGTSDNAARYAQYLFGIHAGLPVALATPSVHTLYNAQPRMERALVIGISQSGQSTDVARVISDAKQQGALTLAITNNPESRLAKAADHHIWLNSGEELSVAATKTYTAQLTAIAMLTAHLTQDAAMLAELPGLPDLMRTTLDLSRSIDEWIQRYRFAQKLAVIGRGYNYATAYEISLKIKELCYITCEEYSEADFRHGPIAMIQRGFPVIVIAPASKPLPLLVDLLQGLHDRRAEALVISDVPAVLEYAQHGMSLPTDIPEWLNPICAVLPGQYFAMKLASSMGHNLDLPPGLTKVTITQ